MNFNGIVNAGVALELEVDRLLDPAQFWDHPRDVVEDPFLSHSEKKAILSSWASDQCAVVSNPLLRKPDPLKRSIAFEEIMEAMKELDAQGAKLVCGAQRATSKSARRRSEASI